MTTLIYNDTLGDARQYDPSGQFLRDVTLLINGWWQSPTLCTNCDSNGIKSTLNFKGWQVEQVVNQTTSWLPGLYGGAIYRVDAVVGRQFSDAQIEQQIVRDLAGFFNINGVTFLTPPYGGLTQTQNTASGVQSGAVGNSYKQSVGPVNSSNPSLDSFASSLGTSLGISAPIAIIGGAVLLALLLRR